MSDIEQESRLNDPVEDVAGHQRKHAFPEQQDDEQPERDGRVGQSGHGNVSDEDDVEGHRKY